MPNQRPLRAAPARATAKRATRVAPPPKRTPEKRFFQRFTIVLAAVIAYWPALAGGRLWDDAAHITRPDLQTWRGLLRIWFDLGATQQYYPLLHSAFWVEHRLWGDATTPYHVVNIALHALSACFVAALVRRLRLPGAWLAGLLFALHPVCVEAVAWISEQKSVLSGVFYLGAALLYLDFDKTRRRGRYAGALVLFILALLSKTVTATLPAALLLALWWKRGRLEWNRDILPLAPWLATGAAAGLFTAWVENAYIGAHGISFSLTAAQRFLLAGRLAWFYLYKLIWPVNLAFVYPHWKLDASAPWQYLFPAAAILVLFLLALLARRARGPLACALYFTGTLFPVLGFFNVYPFRYAWAADHFQYLASLGVLIPAAAGGAVLAKRIKVPKPARNLLALLVLLALGGLTWRQSGFYRSNEVLFAASLAANPDSSMANNNLGYEIVHLPGRMAEAIAHFETALRIDPDSAEAHENLGLALSDIPGRLSEAVAHLQTAARLQPDYPESHLNLGVALAKMPGRLSDAIAEYETALRLKPDYEEAHLDLGTALSQDPARLSQAVEQYRAVIRLDPRSAPAHYSLANTLARVPGHTDEALAEYQAALRIEPSYVQAHANLATLLAGIPGRLPDAIGEYETAIQIDPVSVESRYNLALILSRMPDRQDEAITQLQKVLRIHPGMLEARQLLDRLQASAPRAK